MKVCRGRNPATPPPTNSHTEIANATTPGRANETLS